jgi:hypothetical protein
VTQLVVAEHLTLPIANLVVGGMNGILISPEQDPTDEDALNFLLTAPFKHRHATGYVKLRWALWLDLSDDL